MEICHIVFADKSGSIYSSFVIVQLTVLQANSARCPE